MMRFSRSIPDHFKGVWMKDLPSSVKDKIKTTSRFLEITEGAVIHAIVTDWVAREAAQIKLLGKKRTSDVSPFQFDNFKNIVLGDDLFRLLKAEHSKALITNEASAETHELHLKQIRREVRKSKEDIAAKIEFLLQWMYENTDLVRTPESDKSLSHLIVMYQRAGFSEDQLKDLLVKQAEYLKVKKQPAPQ
jgi:hypothetical protein